MRLIVTAVVAGAAVIAVAGSAFGYAALDKDVQLSVDGAPSEVSTMAGTVGEVLQSKGIELGEHDVVVPALETRLTDGTQIAVQYGRQIRVTVDGQQQTFWTTATHVDEALDTLDLESEGAALSTSRSAPIGREGLSFNLATRKTVTIVDAGTRKRIATTAQTVGAALADAKIKIDGDDLLSTGEDTVLQNGSSFTVTKVDVKTLTKRQRIAYRTTYRDSDRLERGVTEVEIEGRVGVREIEVREVRHNGKLQSREQSASTMTRAPRSKIVLRGTKEPEPQPQPRDDTSSGTRGNGGPGRDGSEGKPGSAGRNGENNPEPNSEPKGKDENDTESKSENKTDNRTESKTENESDDKSGIKTDDKPSTETENEAENETGTENKVGNGGVWDRLAECESGQRWGIDTGNGHYGGLQFSRQSWLAYGGTDFAPLASEATREQQIAIAEKVLDDVGWKAWPACSRKLGLR